MILLVLHAGNQMQIKYQRKFSTRTFRRLPILKQPYHTLDTTSWVGITPFVYVPVGVGTDEDARVLLGQYQFGGLGQCVGLAGAERADDEQWWLLLAQRGCDGQDGFPLLCIEQHVLHTRQQPVKHGRSL